MRTSLIAGAAIVAAGLYALPARGHHAPPVQPTRVASVTPILVSAARPLPRLAEPIIEADDTNLEDEEEEEVEEVHGLAPVTAEEFAFVFEVDGTSYLRLSTDLRAKARGKARMTVIESVYAVVAPVRASAMPDELAKWRDRTVLVNGTCQARVIGFAEVSRVSGDPPGSEEYWYQAQDEDAGPQPEWTEESVVADNVTLAAKLDGCTGTWARSTEVENAQVAHAVEEPKLETDAIADLLASTDGADPIQDGWKEMGGEGNWRDSVDVHATTYEHPGTGEKWIFVSAYQGGGCGEPGASKMAAYRVGANGKLSRFADLDYAGAQIQDVVDLDGDGQPELILDGELVDLANTQHESIEVASHYYGCGC